MSLATLRFSGGRMRAAREDAWLSREQLAVAIGRGYPTVLAYETGRLRPPTAVCKRLARILGCTVADLMVTEDVKPDDA
jgi:DNA-binding XRE family transcriptional regulator